MPVFMEFVIYVVTVALIAGVALYLVDYNTGWYSWLFIYIITFFRVFSHPRQIEFSKELCVNVIIVTIDAQRHQN